MADCTSSYCIPKLDNMAVTYWAVALVSVVAIMFLLGWYSKRISYTWKIPDGEPPDDELPPYSADDSIQLEIPPPVARLNSV